MGLWQSKSPAKILMLGLDAAGKTTIVYKVKLNETIQVIPSCGINIETITIENRVDFTVWDISGKEKLRRIFKQTGHYYDNTEGLIYIVDSNDRERLSESRDELFEILNHDKMRGVPVVVIANKQDLPDAMSLSEVYDGLSLPKLTERKWSIHGACALTGEGLSESFKAMLDFVNSRKSIR